MKPTLRQKIGTLLFDHPVFAWTLFLPSFYRTERCSWTLFHNRDERIIATSDGPGFDCDWRWTSDLTVSKVFPIVGRQLMKVALNQWPIRLEDTAPQQQGTPAVSFIIGHRGAEKVPHLLATIRSIFAQEGASTECVIVEQDAEPRLKELLPEGVCLVHTRPPIRDMPYARAWAFNVGAKHARGRVLIFHDNDILVPARYAAEAVHRVSNGCLAARLQRFVFYLNRVDSAGLLHAAAVDATVPLLVRQNCEGHTLVVNRHAYFEMGGHDETFIGWGGEDNEIYDRSRSVPSYPYADLPFVHLDHAPQPRPSDGGGFMKHLHERLEVPAKDRIRELAARPMGMASGPWGYLERERDRRVIATEANPK